MTDNPDGHHYHHPSWNDGRWNMGEYAPWYQDKADYRTDSASYYDYLARFNYELPFLRIAINQLLKREMLPIDTTTIRQVRNDSWDNVDDMTIADWAKFSSTDHPFTRTLPTGDGGHYTKTYPGNNATYDDSNGVIDNSHGIDTIDVMGYIDDINTAINNMWDYFNQVINNIYDILGQHWHTFPVSIEFKNGFYGEGDYLTASYQTLGKDNYHIKFDVNTVGGTIKNGDMGNVDLCHGEPLNVPKSHIMWIDINQLPGVQVDTARTFGSSGNQLWNIHGEGHHHTTYPTTISDSGKILVSASTYDNGTNDAFPKGEPLNSMNLHVDFFAKKG